MCRRCAADLDILLLIDARAERLAHRAVQLIAGDDWAGAEQVLQEAQKLRQSPFVQSLHRFVQHTRGRTSVMS